MSEIRIQAGIGEVRAALVEQGRLQHWHTQSLLGGDDARLGDIILARVTRVMAGMQAAFVDIGKARAGFLSLRDIPGGQALEGQEIAVRVIREAIGEKGARLAAAGPLPDGAAAKRKGAKPPATLWRGPGPTERALAQMTGPAVVRILVDDTRAWEAARAWCRARRPDCEEKVELFGGPGTLFDDIEGDIESLSQRRVNLPSGGWIAIAPTEALTAIDVNSGNHAASASREETSLAVNLEAAEEIGRQVRLRGIGGLIVVDFIQIADARKILAVLEQSLGCDGVPSDISFLPKLSMAVIARKRMGAPLAALEDCPACAGAGQRRSFESIGQEILRGVARAAAAAPGKAICVRAAPDVSAWLEAHGAQIRTGPARQGAGRVSFQSDHSLARERFDVSTQP
jgi:ribonuclease G